MNRVHSITLIESQLMQTLSIVTSTFNSENEINEFVNRCINASKSVKDLTLKEIIIVDDGSSDSTVEKINEIANNNPIVKILELSKNFGQHIALLEGLKKTQSDLIYMIDSDLEEAPEDLTELSNALIRNSADVAYGVQISRRGSILSKIEGKFFYSLFIRFLGVKLSSNILTSRVMTNEYARAVDLYTEKRVYLAGILEDVGYKQIAVPLAKIRKVKSRYTIYKKIKMALTLASSFSTKPLIYLAVLSISIFVISFTFMIIIVMLYIFSNPKLPGWTSLALSIWMLLSFVSVTLSVLLIYVSEILREVKQRPRAVIKKGFHHE